MKKVLVAMSGGVDSSVAAQLIKDKGYDCIGATMRLFDSEGSGTYSDKTCCSMDDAEDARTVCAKIGIKHYVLDFRGDFRRCVIDRFVNSYEVGETPNPCVDCNRYLKFQALYEKGKLFGCDYIVTGHYARVEKRSDRFLLKKSKDKTRTRAIFYITYPRNNSHIPYFLWEKCQRLKPERLQKNIIL